MNNGKDSAALEREVEAQRQQIESRIGEIRERLSPGQLVDELLSYTKSGGQQFASNLGSTIANNPLPATMLGVSLAWLMAGQNKNGQHHEHHHHRSPSAHAEHDYPYATISGGLKRISHQPDAEGRWYSEFSDSAGKRYKAEANELGHRAGHFVDDAGRQIGGFLDEAGHRVRDFTDEAGNRFSDATGWASHRWHDLQDNVSGMIDQATHEARKVGAQAQAGVDHTTRMIMDAFKDQPLVAGALAFAAGAALGAALPHTKEEDAVIGELADDVRSKATKVASEVYEEGKEKAAELYEKGKAGLEDVAEGLRSEESERRPAGLH